MARDYQAGTTSVSIEIRIIDSTDGTPEVGVVSTTPGLVIQYRRQHAANVSITLSNLAALTTAYTSGGLLHIGNGYYRLDIPDASIAAGSGGVLIHGTATGMVVIGEFIQLGGASDTAGITTLLSRILGTLNTGTHQPQSGDAFARLGAPVGASISADVATRLAPTVAGRTLAVNATNQAGIDWANVGGQATTVALSGTTVGVVTLLNGLAAGVITAASIAAAAFNGKGDWNIGKTGYALSAAGVQAIWDILETSVLFAGSMGLKLKTNIDAAISSRSTYAGADTAGTTTLLSRILGTLAAGTHQPQSGDSFTRLPTTLLNGKMRSSVAVASGTATGGSITTLIDTVGLTQADPDYWKGLVLVFTSGNLSGQTALITAFTPATDTLTFAPAVTQPVVAQAYEIWPVMKNVASTADLETAVSDMLIQYRLDELLAADSDIDGAQPPVVGSVFHELLTKTPGSFTYDQTTDSQEAIRDRGDASWSVDLTEIIGPLVTVVANGANTAISFQVDLTISPNGGPTDAWLSFDMTTVTVALRGQTKRITAFDTATDFVTVASAYTTTPAGGDKARLVTR